MRKSPRRKLSTEFVSAIKAAKGARTFNELALACGFPPGSILRLSQLVNFGERVNTKDEERLRTLAALVGFEGVLFVPGGKDRGIPTRERRRQR